jgi:cation:H+ antiporter
LGWAHGQGVWDGVVSDPLLVLVFVAGAAVSLATSWLLVSRLERVGARLGFSEGLLGMVAALAADAPEITAAVTALIGGKARIGAGVAIGSNLFNLAALLGLASLVTGRVDLHRRAVRTDGAVAAWIAVAGLLAVVHVLSAWVGLVMALALFIPYLVALPDYGEGEVELARVIHPRRGNREDGLEAVLATAVVVGASVAMEQAASTFGAREAVPQIVTGGLVLAAVTSVPNAVAGIYLARRGRGAATLSTALNSNAINVMAGLLLPGTILGLGASAGPSTLVAACNVGLTAFVLLGAYRDRGVRRAFGAAIIVGYVGFAVALVATAG